MILWQYFCNRCRYERVGLLDKPHGIGGYAWACPECGSHDIGSRESETADAAQQNTVNKSDIDQSTDKAEC